MSLFLFLWPVTMANVDRYHPQLRKTSIKTFNPLGKTKLLSLESNNDWHRELLVITKEQTSIPGVSGKGQPTCPWEGYFLLSWWVSLLPYKILLMIRRILKIANTAIWYSMVLQLASTVIRGGPTTHNLWPRCRWPLARCWPDFYAPATASHPNALSSSPP